jgi:transcriptional regulator with XRE-family HTH domain
MSSSLRFRRNQVKAEDGREELSVLVHVLRALRLWDKSELAAAAGLDPAAITRYESGSNLPRVATLERLAAAVGLPTGSVETVLVPVVRLLLALSAPTPGSDTAIELSGALGERGASSRALTAALADAAASALGIAEAELSKLQAPDANRSAAPSSSDRLEGAKLWEQLEPCTAAERRWLVESVSEFRHWALAERLWNESVRGAAGDAAVALELAHLGLRVAELVSGAESWRNLLQGLSRGFVGNALRAQEKMREAEAEFALACRAWNEGRGGDPNGLLPEWRLFDLEASLRRDLRQFEAALTLLDSARSCAPREAVGRILLKRAMTLEQAGHYEDALAALREAAPVIEDTGDLRDVFGVGFNLTVNLCHLGRFAEAESRLSALRAQARSLGNALDLVMVQWVSARVAGGLGRKDEERSGLEKVREEFASRRQGLQTALVSLELAVLHLEDGQTREVREVAEAMTWVLAAEGIEREALAALRLFCAAAKKERVTLEQGRRVLAALRETGRPGMRRRP